MKRGFAIIACMLLVAILPTFAQDTAPVNQIQFNGIGFTADAALGSHINVQQFAGDPVDLEQPGGAQPAHTEFVLYNTYNEPPVGFPAPISVRVYDVDVLQTYPFYRDELASLQAVLSDDFDLAGFMATNAASGDTLPYLPVYPAGQVIRARAERLETDTVRGIRYLTVYRQDASPFIGSEFLYTFQGLSSDGTRYISVVAHLDTPLFPAEYEAFDPEAFMATMDAYLRDSVTTLTDAQPTDFAPDLTLLDTLVQSITLTTQQPG